jgi:excisionase family DNA binding protein
MTVDTIEGAPVVVSDGSPALGDVRAFLRRHAPQGDDALVLSAADGRQQALPQPLVAALDILATLLAQGDDVALVPLQKELTTHEAAALLNVSRPFLIKLLDAGTIPSTKVGTHRRVRLRDVLAYRQRRSVRNKSLLDEALSYAQEHGGYD